MPGGPSLVEAANRGRDRCLVQELGILVRLPVRLQEGLGERD
jgi:hypothetical protein